MLQAGIIHFPWPVLHDIAALCTLVSAAHLGAVAEQGERIGYCSTAVVEPGLMKKQTEIDRNI